MSDLPVGRIGATVYIPVPQFDGQQTEVTGDLYRHLFRARRLAVGDRLRAVDGKGRARLARIVEVQRDRALLGLGEPSPVYEPALRLTLAVALPRPERASWLVEKATEIGVAGVLWLRCERGPRSCSETALERHRRVAMAAMQQCGGAVLPELAGPLEWRELAALFDDSDPVCLLDARGGARPDLGGARRCTVLVGPEGGWTVTERDELDGLGCHAWSLGSRVLRVETAALVAAGALLGR